MSPESRWVAVEVPEPDLLLAAAREGGLTDDALDDLREGLPAAELEAAAASALVLGRAGRASDGPALERLRAALERDARGDAVAAVTLAGELLAQPPPPWIERAEAGYRRVDPRSGEVLYVEDPLAAYWHRRDRWGPPIRPRVERPDVVAHRVSRDAALDAALDGRLVRVDFAGREGVRRRLARSRLEPVLSTSAAGRRLVGRPEAVWLTRAGFSCDRSLRSLVRWSEVRSLGFAGHRRVAIETAGGPRPFPRGPALSPDALLALVDALVRRARAS